MPTALTGLSDWLDTSGAERRVGLVHLASNPLATSCYALSWLARRKGHTAAGIGWSVVGAGVASMAGWLGGHLTYAMGARSAPCAMTWCGPAPLRDGAALHWAITLGHFHRM